MNRIANQPGLRADEIAFATADAQWPRARLRVTPLSADQDDRLHQPNADPVPPRIEVRMSASLIDAGGAVERIAGKLLLGPESIHAWQFDADTAFEPAAWIDDCAARMIADLLRQARGIKAAADAGLIVAA